MFIKVGMKVIRKRPGRGDKTGTIVDKMCPNFYLVRWDISLKKQYYSQNVLENDRNYIVTEKTIEVA